MMANPVMVIHTTHRHGAAHHKWRTCWMWCPGCDHMVQIPVAGVNGELPGAPDGPHWDWDGNLEQPTFDPSILQYASGNIPRCHSYLRAGRWEFLSDSTHKLAGQTVDMVPVPDWLCKPPVEDDEEVTWP